MATAKSTKATHKDGGSKNAKPSTKQKPAAAKAPATAAKQKPSSPATKQKPAAAKAPAAQAKQKPAARAQVSSSKPVVAKETAPYMAKADRKKQLDTILLRVLKEHGVQGTTRAKVAAEAGVSNSLLRVYYEGGTQGMIAEAVNLAGAAGDAKTVQAAVAAGHPKAAISRKYWPLLK